MTDDRNRFLETHLRAAVESAPSGLVMADAEGRIVLVNREIERLFGYSREELLGQPIELLVPMRSRGAHPNFRGEFLRDPRARSMGAGRDLYGVRKDGVEVPVEIGLTPVPTPTGVFVLGAVVDITTRRRHEEQQRALTEQLRQAQKLEAVGTLAGGIAHDFNNILGGILGYAELIAASLPSGSPIRRDAEEILAISARGKSLVERILAFSRRQEARRSPMEIGTVIMEIQQLLRATLPADIELVVRVSNTLPRVLADSTSVHQVLMNLATNSSHAMPGGGRLEIAASPLYVRDSVARANPGLREGAYVALEVRDSGVGMSEETKRRAFEPFYTTKPTGAGTGLGLAMVHGIMFDHDGAVLLESAPGHGTVIRCLFPTVETDEPEPGSLRHVDAPEGRGELVLLVDDEPSLLEVGKRRLERLGYRVRTSASPEHALALFEDVAFSPALLVTDYSMPGMSGVELATRVTSARRGIPVILLTGFIDTIADGVLASAGIQQVVRKPITITELATVCALALSRKAAD